MDTSVIYLYGFIPTPNQMFFNIAGIDGANQLYLINYKDISAVVSNVPAEEYSQEPFAKNLEDMGWLKEKAVLHSEIINQLFFESRNLIPSRFGTIFTCQENVYDFLNVNYESIRETLCKTKNKEEWGIKLYCDINKFIDTSMVDEKKSILMETSNISKGARYFLHKKLADTITGMAKNKIITLSQSLFAELLTKSCDGKLNKLLSKDAAGVPFDMFLNAVFLLDRDSIQPFKEYFDHCKKVYECMGVYLEQTGPWPPYNFCSF